MFELYLGRIKKLYYFFLCCDKNKFEELEMFTDTRYQTFAKENLEDCILPEKKAEWLKICRNDCWDNSIADAKKNFFPCAGCGSLKKYDEREPDLFKAEFRCTEMLCLCSKTYCCNISKSTKFKQRTQ